MPWADNPRSAVFECASCVHSLRIGLSFSVDRAVGTSSGLHTGFLLQFEGAFFADYVIVILPPHTGHFAYESWVGTSHETSNEGP